MLFRAFSLLVLLSGGLPAQDLIQEVRPQAGNDVRATLVVSGSVERASADGDTTLPPEIQVTVECRGDQPEGVTVSPSGQYRLTISPDPKAIAAGTICTVEAKVFGYDSTLARFPARSSTGMIALPAITITRNSTGVAADQGSKVETGPTVSATSLKAPPKAVRLFTQGQKQVRQKKTANAAKSFEAAIQIYPEYADAWMNLGLLAAERNDLMAAVRDLDEALRLDPEASFQACYSDALVNLMLKRYEVAEKSARAALRFGDAGANARVDFVLGMALIARGADREAWQRLTRYLDLAPGAPEREQVQDELARLARIAAAKH
ncbi:MAG TPA: tetratricopeptide repeat protein [Bryobacteraceae bacterium]|nr:tetratricopeptide repeat protein [Bryobacteraceae bacterium]